MDYAEAFEIQRGAGGAAQARRDCGPVSDCRASAHDYAGAQRTSGKSAGARGYAGSGRASRFIDTDRGGDITYHGPGQIVGYPIVDLREWKRDVGAYVRAIEQVIIDTLADFGIAGGRVPPMTGVWVAGAKIAAIGVHISRWVTSHGFALNVTTDLSYFQYIVPCGLVKPVTSMAALGVRARREDVIERLVHHFGRVFDREMSGETDL